GITLLLKPGPAHVFASLQDALRLRAELPHANLGFIMDPAAFLLHSSPGELRPHLEELLAQLGPCAPLVHAKDIRHDAERIATPRAGSGILAHALLLRYRREAPLILKHLRPEEVAATGAFIVQEGVSSRGEAPDPAANPRR